MRLSRRATIANTGVAAVVVGELVATWFSPLVALLAAVALLGVVCLCSIPVSWLPAAAVAQILLLDLPYLPFTTPTGSIGVGVLIILVWVVRRAIAVSSPLVRAHAVFQVLAVALSAWVLVSLVLSFNRTSSALWTIGLFALVITTALLLTAEESRMCIRVFLVVGSALSLYAVLEFATNTNTVWGSQGLGATVGSSTDRRVSAGFGSPIYAGLVFATIAVVSFDWARRALRRRRWTYVVVLLNGVAVLTTGARGAVIAMIVGGVLIVAYDDFHRARRQAILRSLRSVGIAAVVLVGGLLLLTSLRPDVEGSTDVHARSLSTGLYIASSVPWHGYGPGLAYSVKTSTPGPGTDEERSVENAWLELVIAIGYPGAVLIAALLATAFVVALARGRPLPAAVLLGYAIEYFLFNVLEGHRPGMILLGVFLGAACFTRDSPGADAAAMDSKWRPHRTADSCV